MKKLVLLTIILFLAGIASSVGAYTINSGLESYSEGDEINIFASAYEDYCIEVYGLSNDCDFEIVIYSNDERRLVIDYEGQDRGYNYKYIQFYVKKDQIVSISVESDNFCGGLFDEYDIAISRSIDCYDVTNYRGVVINEDNEAISGALVKTDWGGSDITNSKGRFDIIDCWSVNTISAQKNNTFSSIIRNLDNVIILKGVEPDNDSGCFIQSLHSY